MGVLDWQVWDRLDDLDRRAGLRRELTPARQKRAERILWIFTTVLALGPVVAVVNQEWGLAVRSVMSLIVISYVNWRVVLRNRERLGSA